MTSKCAQLLSGFSFDRAGRVLEVGSGCAGITRLLGERFDEVVSVEGSRHRARLASERTRDLPGVTVICQPFRESEFTEKFDTVFCIGGLGDCAPVDSGEDVYHAALGRLADLLTPDGVLLLAVEKQRGLESTLREHFAETRFYYPYPNYQHPDCVISEDFLSTKQADGLVAEMYARANVGVEPDKHRNLPFFANSFLVVAGKQEIRGVSFDQLAYLVSSARRDKFRTTTRIVEGDAGKIWVKKRPSSGADTVQEGPITLTRCDSPWVDTPSLQTVLDERCQVGKGGLAQNGLAKNGSAENRFEQIFKPCAPWVRFLEATSVQRGGERYLSGGFVDCTWDDVFAEGDGFRRIDEEWTWAEDIAMNVVVIRAIYYFLIRIEGMPGLPRELERRSGKTVIREIAGVMGVQLIDSDFAGFVTLEAAFQSIVFGLNETRYRLSLRWYLRDRPSQGLFRTLRRLMKWRRSIS